MNITSNATDRMIISATEYELVVAAVFLWGIILVKCLYRVYIHPLSSVPGPRIAACTSLWLAYHTYVGDECSVIYELHKKYGPVLRMAPNDVDIDEGDAVEPIYITNGGFPKTPAYAKFDIDGHATIFSTLTLAERARRAKAVSPLFSTASIRSSKDGLSQVVDDFVDKVRAEARKSPAKAVNVLNATRSMAIDIVSTHLFHQRYGAVTEDSKTMSASPFVDAYVAVGSFFNIWTGRLGDIIQHGVEYLRTDSKTEIAFELIDRYTKQLIATSVPNSGSYQSRLLETVSMQQSQIELKDVCFAGTDSTGMTTATIMWHLTKNPKIYTRLQEEVNKHIANNEDPTTGSYLRGVVREGLRLGQANPTRLPRQVPLGGWKFKEYFFPTGTSVGISAFQLHQNEAVFHDASAFSPSRWEDPNDAMLTHFFAFGKGTRTCIAQSLAMSAITLATLKLAQSDLLRGATAMEDRIEIIEWFNSKVKGEKITIKFAQV